MTGNDPWKAYLIQEEGSVTVTLKQGKSVDSAWIVVKHANAGGARRLLAETFGFDPQSPEISPFTLAELTAEFSRSFQNLAHVQRELNARVIDPDSGVKAAYGSRPEDTATVGQPSAVGVWAGKPGNVLGIRDAIVACESSQVLNGVIWKQYFQTIQGDGDLLALFKERAGELAAAEKESA